MTDKQTAALKLALEALKMCRALIRINIERLVPIESPNPWFSRDVDHAITAIREALAEQEDPDLQDKDPELVEQPTQCWKCGDMDAIGHSLCTVPACGMREQPAQQQEPLTDEQIEDIWADCPADWDDKINVLTLARAIEAAHGIKGDA